MRALQLFSLQSIKLRYKHYRNSLPVQWLGLGTFTAGAWVQSLVGELRSQKQWCGQKKKKKGINIIIYISSCFSLSLSDIYIYIYLLVYYICKVLYIYIYIYIYIYMYIKYNIYSVCQVLMFTDMFLSLGFFSFC